MNRVKFIKNQEDINSIVIGDTILVRYKSGKMFQVKIIRIEKDILIGNSIMNGIQETFINKDSLLNDYIKHVILEKDIKREYGSRLDKFVREMTIEATRTTKAYASRYFCDNIALALNVKVLTNSILLINYERLLSEISKQK
jgi:hypothetical protein